MNDHLQFDVSWVDPPGGDREGGAALAWGEGLLRLDGVPIWFTGSADAPKPIGWSWIELLEFLARRWLHLTTEQTYPRGLVVADPLELRSKARKVLGSHYSDDELPDDVDEEIFRFEGRHDLSRAVRGISLAPFYVLREGNTVRLSTSELTRVAESRSLFAQLEKIADAISTRLETSNSARAKTAVDAWKHRTNFDPKDLIRVASGNASVGTPTLEFWELVNEPGADSELAAAARFVAGEAPGRLDLENILSTIRQQPAADCTNLDSYSDAARSVVDEYQNKDPFEQGYALALEFRRKLNVVDGQAVDVEKYFGDFGIAIIEQALSTSIDGIGVWGRRHGPTIILNTRGRRASTPHGRRFTLAHELCHLLTDRTTALPLAEVMGGSSPYRLERRANAFGAELLLPRWQARTTFQQGKSVDDTLTALMARYRVGRVLAAAQLLNASITGLTPSQKGALEQIVQEDRAYGA